MKFIIEPFVGAKPILFGMSSEEVHKIMGKLPESSRPSNEYGGPREDYHELGINYDNDGAVAEICFSPVDNLQLIYKNKILIGANAIVDPNELFETDAGKPVETFGFLVYQHIGINTAGYHDNEPSQEAINVFRKGYWDDEL